jgi:hypothetical protein
MKTEIYRGINPKDEKVRGWVVGSFMEKGLPKTSNVEVKFEKIEKGRVRESEPKENEVNTMAILTQGKIVFDFEGHDEPFLLNKPGDHVIWSPNCYHSTFAYEDTTLISIRWREPK